MTPDWAGAWALVREAERILIVCHVQPDGDAISTMLALGLLLRERGKQVDLAVDGGLPPSFAYLDGSETIGDTPRDGRWDLFISVDSSDEKRTGHTGALGRQHSRRVLNIDHHITNEGFGDGQLILTSAVSATEIVYRWLRALDLPLSKPIAQALLTGLVTDTQGFRTDNVREDTLGIAHDLMKCGASMNQIMNRTLNQRSFASLQLWQRVLPTVRMEDGVIYASISKAVWQASGLAPGQDGGLVSFLRQVREAAIAAVFLEMKAGEIKVELRCAAQYNVAQVAHSLGGGGHQQASGATVHGTLEETAALVLPLLRAALEQGGVD